jgi:hypothetical protein
MDKSVAEQPVLSGSRDKVEFTFKEAFVRAVAFVIASDFGQSAPESFGTRFPNGWSSEMRHDDEKSAMVRQPNFEHGLLMRCAKTFDFKTCREGRSRRADSVRRDDIAFPTLTS